MSGTIQEGAGARGEVAEEAAVRARLRRRRPARARRTWSRWFLRASLLTAVCVALLGAALVSALYLMLARGPLRADMLGERIASSIDARLGAEYDVTLGRTTIESGAHGPFIAVSDLRITSGAEGQVFAAPRATVSLDPLLLLTGRVAPRRIELFDVDLHLVVAADGGVALSAGAQPFLLGRAPDAPPSGPVEGPPPVGEHAAVRALGDALRRTLALALGDGSPLGSLQHIGIARGRLMVEDRAADHTTTFESFEVALDKQSDAALLTLAATGPSGRWSASAQARNDSGAAGEGPRSLDIEFRDLSMDEVSLLLNLRAPPVDFDTPVSARLQLSLDQNGRLTTADGRFVVGSGFFYFRAAEQEPIRVDEITGRLNWDAAARRFDVGPVSFHSGRTHLMFSGRAGPVDEKARAWRIELAGAPGALGALKLHEADVQIETSRLSVTLDPDRQMLTVDRLDLFGPRLHIESNAQFEWTPGQRNVKTRVDVRNTGVDAVMRLWPSLIAPKPRAWFLSHKNSGRIEYGSIAVALDEASLDSMAARKPISEDAVNIEGSIVDSDLAFMPGVPSISGLSGKVQVTGRKATFTATSGFMETAHERRLTLVEGRFEAGEFGTGAVKGQVNVRATGSVDAVSDLIAVDGLKPYGGFPIERGLVRGQVDGRVTVDLFMEPQRPAAVRVATQINNMSVERVIGKERLDQGSLALTADSTGVRATGQGRLLGNQVRIDLRKPPAAPTEVSIALQLDEAARARQGWHAPAVSGPLGVKVTTLLGVGDKARPVVELDLTRAGIAITAGLSKPAGRAAKATFSLLHEPQKTTLQSFAYEGGAASAQGVIELDGNGAFSSASFSQLKLSPGDDMKVEIAKSRDGGYRLQVRGTSIDARPFTQQIIGGGQETGEGVPLDLDMKSNLVSGANGQTLSNVDLKLVTRTDGLREFRLSARSGRAAVSGGALAAQPGSPQQFYIRTEDGGAILSFLDLYRRMDGGRLQLVGFGNGRKAAGMLSVRNFTLRNEAALQKLVSEGARGREEQLRIDPTAVPFDRLEVAFTRSGGRLDLRDGIVSGPSIGATIEGAIDFTRDQVALNGTFVPAYGLNNMFSRIPLFGPLLGGGANEGLIGINFRIAGSATAPLLTLNPLSAMTPGFLRKIFGAADAVTLPPENFPAQPAPSGASRMPMSISPR